MKVVHKCPRTDESGAQVS